MYKQDTPICPPCQSEIIIIRRLERYLLKNTVARWLNPTRTYYCKKCRGQAPVDLRYSIERERATASGLFSCGLGWTCPVCGEKISESMASEIDQAMSLHLEQGYHALHATWTIPHHQGQLAGEVLRNLQKSRDMFLNRKSWRTFKVDIGFRGGICSKDYTWGEASGSHIHLHEALLHKRPVDIEDAQNRLREMWASVALALNLPVPNDHGLKLTEAYQAGSYLCKWGTGRELTKGHSKTGKDEGRHSVFDLIRHGHEAVFKDYAAAFSGKQHVTWSRGLRSELGICPDKTDQERADETDHDSGRLGSPTDVEWERVVNHQPLLFEAIESACKPVKLAGGSAADIYAAGWSAALSFIAWIKP